MKSIYVNADGTTEEGPMDAAGRFCHRGAKCTECGALKPERKYEIHWANDVNTRKLNDPYRSGPPSNEGVLVLVEVPV